MGSSTRLLPLASGLGVFLLILASCSVQPAGTAGDASSAGAAEADPLSPWDWPEERVFEAVNEVRAGRDLTPEAWPDGARVAVALSFDVDNETIWLRNGDTNVGGLSQGEYGSRRALGRVLDALDEAEIPASFFIPAMSLTLAPEMADMIAESGRHEFAVHGWIHERNTQLDAATERRLLEQSIDRLQEITGVRPVGYRAPSWNFSPATLDIVMDLGFRYESSLMADDRPYEILQRGEPTGMVELPVDWILDDAPLMNPLGDRYSPPRDVLQVYIDEFDRAWEEGTLFVLTMHPHYIGHRSRIVVLEELIDHMRRRGRVWFATHLEVAEYVRAQAGMD
jgi:peptidoglycan/xylan/chitin deacetylase (PgdA/CDA1 family)